MIKYFQILFLTFLSLSAFAQEINDSLPTKKESKWNVAVLAGGTITKPNYISSIFPADVDKKLKMKYNIELDLGYKFCKSTLIFLSASYDVLEYGHEYSYQNYYEKFIYHFTVWNTSLLLEQNIGKKNLKFNFGAGLQFGRLSENSIDITYVYSLPPFQSQHFTNGKNLFESNIYIGLNYEIYNAIHLLFKTHSIYSIKGIEEYRSAGGTSGIYKYNPIYYKINLGLCYNF